jgi:hypothetical protein
VYFIRCNYKFANSASENLIFGTNCSSQSSVKNVRTEIMYIILLFDLLFMCFETWSHIKGV